jgi:tryptophan-rich sensory protein
MSPTEPAPTPPAELLAAVPTTDPSRPDPRRHRALALLAFGGTVAATAVVGGRFGPRPGSPTQAWYSALRKPPFQPPPQVFAPVWTGLYASIAASGYRVWRTPGGPTRTTALGLWATQMIANAAWTPTFFGARRPRLALAVLAVQLSSTVAYSVAAARTDPVAGAMVGPYVGWSGFAFALNEEIVRRNRR